MPETMPPVASADALTDLPDRAAFHAALAAALAQTDPRVGILLVQLDDFHSLKKTLGTAVTDKLLVSVATRIIADLDDIAFIARSGDDEFAVLLPGADSNSLRELGQAVCRIVRHPDPASGTGLRISASIGAALAPDDATSSCELIHCAAVAQFVARSSGRDRVLTAKPSLRTQIQRSVRDCVAAGNFGLHYQPIVALADPTRLLGLEAFLRWQHPTRGLIFPGDFAPVLEEPQAALAIGAAALAEAAAQIKRWLETGVAFGQVGLNVSAVQLREAAFADQVLAVLLKRGVPAPRLALELPEDIYLSPELPVIADRLRQLSGAGVRLAVDGWAQGELGFATLARLPVAELKLDRAFVQSASLDTLRQVVARASAAGLEIGAEGVETAEERDRLAESGVTRAQGWLFGRPMAPGKVAAFVAKLAASGTERLAA